MTDPSFATPGLGLLLFASSVGDVDNLTVDEFAGAVDLTYALTSFEPVFRDVSYMLWGGKRTRQVVDSVDVEWVYHRTEPSAAQLTLTPGASGVVAWRLGYPHDTPVDAGQIFNLIIPVLCGTPADAPLGPFGTKRQTLDVTGWVGQEATVH